MQYKILDLVTRRLRTLSLRPSEVCVSSVGEWAEWLGLDIKRNCVPLTPSSYSNLIRLFQPMGDFMLATGYVLPDTIRIVACRLALIEPTGEISNYEVLYDTRTNYFGVQHDNAFLEIENLTECGPQTQVMVGTLVKTADGKARVIGYMPTQIYARWARAVLTANFEESLVLVKEIKRIIESYEAAINELRSRLATSIADAGTLITEIVEQYLRPYSAIAKAVQKEEKQGRQ